MVPSAAKGARDGGRRCWKGEKNGENLEMVSIFGEILMNHEPKHYLPSIIYNENEDSLFNIILVLYF